MKEKTKEFMKKYLIGFILGVLTVGIIKVSAETFFPSNQVTYDNTASGLESTNVQGAIDELYGVCFPPKAGDQIIEDNGLEKDPYECRYFFTGATPNNYVTFNGETVGWRIISVGCDGTIKIMRTANIGNRTWDSLINNNWARPTTLNTYLNGTYLNSLSSEAQGQIVASDYSIGPVTLNNNDLASQVNNENSTTWNGKIALPTVSEYLRTNSNSNCKTFSTYNNNSNTCRNTTWMYYSSNNWWTLSPNADASDDSDYVFTVNSSGDVSDGYAGNPTVAVRPTITLSSEVQITGGNGTQSDPYVVS